jgi:aspartate/methionine/tyrosine aminotransferase
VAVDWAPYMHWSKVHPDVPFELSGSNLLPCTVDDLPGARECIELSGPNDEGYRPLTDAIGGHYGVDSGRVCTAAGASGANFLAIAALVRGGEEVLAERPGYDPHAGAARLIGATVSRFDRSFEDGFRIDPGRVAAAVTERTRLVVVTNPHNPSGVLATEEDLDGLARLAGERGFHVLVDEVYLDVAPGRPPYAALRSKRMISTSSLTKAYGLSGLRAGWAVASEPIAEAMRRVRDVVDAVGAFPAERLAVLAFAHLPSLKARADAILTPNRRVLADFVGAHELIEWVVPSGGAVAFPRIRGVDDAGPFVAKLRAEYETGLVPGSFFGTPAHFRIALGGEHDVLLGGLEALGRALHAI